MNMRMKYEEKENKNNSKKNQLHCNKMRKYKKQQQQQLCEIFVFKHEIFKKNIWTQSNFKTNTKRNVNFNILKHSEHKAEKKQEIPLSFILLHFHDSISAYMLRHIK